MADRFPSLEDFDSGAQTESTGNAIDLDTSAPDDFLARERALLGDDAGRFASNDKSASFEDADDDLLGGGDSNAQYGDAREELNDFTSSFPDISHSEQAPVTSSITNFSTYKSPQDVDEPEVIIKWRETRNAQMAERAERSAQKEDDTQKQAQKDLDEFYENYNQKKTKTIQQTRKDADDFLANRDDTTSGGTSWERIAKLVDLSGKGSKGGASGTGKERFREVLLSLRKDDKAPGASGV